MFKKLKCHVMFDHKQKPYAMSNEIVDPCPICINPYTKAIRKEVKCQYCNESACSKCIESYLLNTIDDPHCPHCRRAWNRGVISGICTRTFLNQTYFKYRQGILLTREKSYMPQLQEAAQREKRARELDSEEIDAAKQYNELVVDYNKKLQILTQRRGLLFRRAANIRAGRDEITGRAADGTMVEERAKFIRHCTANDCKGFLSSVWKCGLCNVWVCPDCFEVKGTDKDTPHTCTADMLETAKLIKKDTKPCPSCGEMIMKIEGCDQMFCTSCHNAFSWNSGKIVVAGPIHNPHYFQWLARGGQPVPQNPGNIPCGGLPDAYYLRRSLTTNRVSAPEIERFMGIYRTCAHVIDVERHRFERHLIPNNNQDIGIKFMLNEINEEEWKHLLAKREKDRQKSNEIRDVLDAFNGAAIDLFRRIEVGQLYDIGDFAIIIRGILEELNVLRDFTMEALQEVSKSFNCSIPMIDHTWKVIHGKGSTLVPKTKPVKRVQAGAGMVQDTDCS